MLRSILHCDMNNFYASVECMLDPALKKYPIAVCGSVEERHGIVLAKNYKAKAFDMRENRMEYEANIFASQASLPDDTILEYIENGYDIQQIARALCSDINLIALKVDTLIAQGYQLRKQEHQNDFLKYSKKI